VVILTLISALLVAWWPVAPRRPPPVQWYTGQSHGAAATFRVTERDSSITYQSASVSIARGPAAALLLGDILSPVMFRFEQEPDLAVADNRATNIDATGTFSETTSILLLEPDMVSIAGEIAGERYRLDPPLPLLIEPLAPGTTQTVTGTYTMNLSPYTSTLTIIAHEPVEVPAGRLEDCWKVQRHLQLPWLDRQSTIWFCGGVGIARSEHIDADKPGKQVFELIAASTPGLVAAVADSLPSGVSPAFELPPAPARTTALAPRWAHTEFSNNESPVTVPVAAGGYLFYGTEDGRLVALDRVQQAPAWRFQTGGIVTQPAVVGNMVFVGATDGKLYALDRRTGALRWAFVTRDAITAPPAAAGDMVFVASEEGVLYALEAQTGRERWQYRAGEVLGAPLVVDGDTVYAGSDNGALYALATASGEERWAFAAGSPILTPPLIRDGRIYLGASDGMVYALHPPDQGRTAEVVWEYDSRGSIETPMAASDNILYLTLIGGTDATAAVDLATGTERWRTVARGDLAGAPQLLGDLLAVLDEDEVVRFDPQTGTRVDAVSFRGEGLKRMGSDGHELFVVVASSIQVIGDGAELPWAPRPRWRSILTTNMGAYGAPVPWRDQLLVLRLNGSTEAPTLNLLSVDRADGAQEHLGTLGTGTVAAQPTVLDDTYFLQTNEGQVLAFDLITQQVRWQQSTALNAAYNLVVAADGVVLVYGKEVEQGVALAFDAASGALRWRREFAATALYPQLWYDGRFYLGADAIYALDPATGQTIWQSEPAGTVVDLVIDEEYIYALGLTDQSTTYVLHTYHAATGRTRRAVMLPIPAWQIPVLSGPMVVRNGMAVVALDNGALVAVDVTSGTERWRQTVPGRIQARPVIAGNRVYVYTRQLHLRAYALAEGQVLADIVMPHGEGMGNVQANTPLIIDDTLYGALLTTVFALPLQEERSTP
jgi:outer membrane protein assembly factor BamB